MFLSEMEGNAVQRSEASSQMVRDVIPQASIPGTKFLARKLASSLSETNSKVTLHSSLAPSSSHIPAA